jgi:branched-chain amino acid transport system substrate-binding protein
MRSMLLAVLLAVGSMFLCVSCRKDGANTSTGPIKIGLNLPLSGALESYGKNVRAGIELRLKEINDAGGIGGRKIELLVEDNRGDSNDSRKAYKKLAQIDGACAVIGPITSSLALALKIDVEQCKVPLMTPTATNDKVTQNTRFMFRTCYVDSFQGAAVARYAFSQGAKTAAVLTDNNSDYSKGLSASFTKAFEALGGKIVAAENYQQKDTDFGTQLVRVKNAGADVLFVPGYPPEVPLVVKGAKVVGFPNRLCGGDGWDDPTVLRDSGDNIEGCFMLGAFSSEDTREIVKQFVAASEKGIGRTPGTFEALGYDSLTLIAEAIKRGGDKPEQIAQSLRELKDVQGVTGKISMTAGGDARKDGFLLKVVRKDGKFVTQYVSTIAPE